MDFTYKEKLDALIHFNKANVLELNVEQATEEDMRTITITLRDFLTGKVYGYTGEVPIANLASVMALGSAGVMESVQDVEEVNG